MAMSRSRGDRRHVAAADHHPSRVRLLEAGDDAQHRRLAAAARAENGEEAAGLDDEVDRVDRRAGRAAEALRDAVRARRRDAACRLVSADCAKGHSSHHLSLHEEDDDDERQERHHRRRR